MRHHSALFERPPPRTIRRTNTRAAFFRAETPTTIVQRIPSKVLHSTRFAMLWPPGAEPGPWPGRP